MTTQTINDNDEDLDDENEQQAPAQPTSRQLREAAKNAEKTRAENVDLKQKLAVYEAGLGNLTPKQVKSVLANVEGEVTAEVLRATAVELAFIEEEDTAETQQIEAEVREQGRISAAASGAGRAPANAQLTPTEVAAWPIDKQMRLLDEHPDIYDRLLAGETVSGVPFV